MFTLGNKELIVNSTSSYSAETEGTVLKIKGFGDFDSTNVLDVQTQEFLPALYAGGAFVCPAASTLGIAATDTQVPITFAIDVLSSRFGADEARDFIKFGGNVVLEFFVDGIFSGTEVMTALEDAMSAHEQKFLTSSNRGGSLPFTWGEAKDESEILWLAGKEGHLGFAKHVTFNYAGLTKSFNTPFFIIDGTTTGTGYLDNPLYVTEAAPASIGDTIVTVHSGQLLITGSIIEFSGDIGEYYAITKISDNGATWKDITLNRPLVTAIGTESVSLLFSGGSMGTENNVDGKYLEENVRMDTSYTNAAYSLRAGDRPIISAEYVSYSWTSTAPIGGVGRSAGHRRLRTAEVDGVTGTQNMKYTIYFNKTAFGSIRDAAINPDGNLLEQMKAWLPPAVITGFLKDTRTEFKFQTDAAFTITQGTEVAYGTGTGVEQSITGLQDGVKVVIELDYSATYFVLTDDSWESLNLVSIGGITTLNGAFSGTHSIINFECDANLSKVTDFGSAWFNCDYFSSFPMIDVSSGTNFELTWAGCTSLTSFPALDFSSGTIFASAWHSCTGLVSFDGPIDFTSLDEPGGGANTFADCTLLTAPAATGTGVRNGDDAKKGTWSP